MTSSTGARFAFRVGLTTLCLALIPALVVWLTTDYVPKRDLWVARLTGYGAVGMLCTSLLCSPLIQWAGNRMGIIWRGRLNALRRSLGINAAILGGLHALSITTSFYDQAWRHLMASPQTRTGMLALLILALLLLTSFPPISRALRLQTWKELHRLIYAAALLVVWHIAYSSRVAIPVLFTLAALIVLLLLSRIFAFIFQTRISRR